MSLIDFFPHLFHLPTTKTRRRYREARQLGQRYERIQKEMAAEGKMKMSAVATELGNDVPYFLPVILEL